MPTHTAEIIIQASPERVFEALTNPELVKLWQYGRVVTSDWKVGSKIKFISQQEGSNTFEEWGTILDIRTNEFIKYSLFTPRPDLEDKSENYCVTSYRLSDKNGHALIEIIQEDNRPSGFTSSTLKPILAALKRVAENK